MSSDDDDLLLSYNPKKKPIAKKKGKSTDQSSVILARLDEKANIALEKQREKLQCEANIEKNITLEHDIDIIQNIHGENVILEESTKLSFLERISRQKEATEEIKKKKEYQEASFFPFTLNIEKFYKKKTPFTLNAPSPKLNLVYNEIRDSYEDSDLMELKSLGTIIVASLNKHNLDCPEDLGQWMFETVAYNESSITRKNFFKSFCDLLPNNKMDLVSPTISKMLWKPSFNDYFSLLENYGKKDFSDTKVELSVRKQQYLFPHWNFTLVQELFSKCLLANHHCLSPTEMCHLISLLLEILIDPNVYDYQNATETLIHTAFNSLPQSFWDSGEAFETISKFLSQTPLYENVDKVANFSALLGNNERATSFRGRYCYLLFKKLDFNNDKEYNTFLKKFSSSSAIEIDFISLKQDIRNLRLPHIADLVKQDMFNLCHRLQLINICVQSTNFGKLPPISFLKFDLIPKLEELESIYKIAFDAGMMKFREQTQLMLSTFKPFVGSNVLQMAIEKKQTTLDSFIEKEKEEDKMSDDDDDD